MLPPRAPVDKEAPGCEISSGIHVFRTHYISLLSALSIRGREFPIFEGKVKTTILKGTE
jgi:hypothetical protein